MTVDYINNNNNNSTSIIDNDNIETPLLNDEIENTIKKPLSQHKYKKEVILIYLLYAIITIASFLYGLFLPNLFLDYVSYNYPNLTQSEIQSKASFYKSISGSFPYIPMFFFGPILGIWSDKFGRKPIILVSIVVTILDFISCFISMKTHNLIYFYIMHTIAGIANVMPGAIYSYVADLTDDEHVSMVFSFGGAVSTGIGVIFGPLIFSFLSSKYSNDQHLPIYISFILLMFCLIVTPFLKESLKIAISNNKIKQSNQTSNPFKLIKILFSSNSYLSCIILLYASISYTSQDVLDTYYYYCELVYNWTASENGYFLTYIGVIIIIYGLFLIPFLLKYFSVRRLISLGFALSICAHILFILSGKSQYMFIVGGALIGYVPNNANLISSLISIETPSSLQGTILTGIQALGAISGFVGAMVANQVYMYSVSNSAKIYLPQAPYLVNGCVVLITFCGSLLIWRIYKNKSTSKKENAIIN